MGLAEIARALTGRRVEPEAALVFWLNGLVSIAVGIAFWIRLDWSAAWAFALVAAVFVALLVSLLNPYATIVAGVLGSLVAGAIGALIGASFGLRYGGDAGAWVGGLLAGGALILVAAASYRKLVRAVLAARSGAASQTSSPTPRSAG
ncbi:MAG TPA: hypothetical protein VFH68_17535 [Polyangia bacterium]|nr:hypothetical protein [Polyangia bacterium]